MCEQNENNYLDGDVVWVKLGSCWWPGEVVGPEKLPPDVLPSFKKPPIAVVKFYQEDTYEYVKNLNSIFKYNCSRKNEFINKGLYMYRTKHGHMDKFPEDVIRAEIAVGGDKEILTRDEFQEVKKESYAGLFGDPRRTPASIKKGKNNKGRLSNESTPVSRLREKTNYKVHILVQGTKSPRQSTESAPSPSTSRAGSEPLEATPQKEEKPQPEDQHAISTPNTSTPGLYACHACNFNTTRLNVLIMHNKTHSATFTPYTPTLTHLPIKKKLVAKTAKASPDTTSSPKIRKTKQEIDEKPVKKQAKKRIAEETSDLEVKKSKTDAEIKSSLLADWDDGDEESNDESSIPMGGSPEIPIASESPAVPTSAGLPSAQMPDEVVNKLDKNEEQGTITEKPETSNDAKYEFCEDEDWPVETDIGRKIPRVKNPSKRKEETKSLSIDEDEMAREVAELLSKTTLPEMPSAPETFKEEENFPDPSVVKSPDKQLEKVQNIVPEKKSSNDTQPAKTIFKTKTFFRSRHSRSQDAIGKYVAEQLNAAERLDMSENEINGTESVPSIEPRISPTIEHVKVARLAPKIQLKKMKAEAAQLLEREKHNTQKNKEQTNIDIPNIIGVEKAAEGKKNHNEEDTLHQNYMTTDNQNIDLSMKDTNKVYEREHEPVNDKIKKIDKDVPVAQEKTLSETTIVGSDYPTKITEIIEPLMNESTASAVDALLSVSRETDRVTKIISDDPPEDLFEDDNKDNRMLSIANGINNEEHKRNGISEIVEICSVSEDAENATHDHLNISIDQGKIHNISSVLEEVESKKDSSIVSQPLVHTVSNNTISEENHKKDTNNLITENIPSESDLQVAEALINLPSTNAIHNKVPIEPQVTMKTKAPEKKFTLLNSTLDDGYKNIEGEDKNISISEISSSVLPESIIANNESITSRFETEQEKCENLFAAQSLVQMSESIDHNINITEVNILKEKEIITPILSSIIEKEQVTSSNSSNNPEQNVILSSSDIVSDQTAQTKSLLSESNSPKLLKILEEPTVPKIAPAKKSVGKQLIVPGNEKILNFDIGKASLKSKSPKQKIIIRRATPTKTIINNIAEKPTSHKIILSPSTKSIQEGSSIKTYAIKSAPDVSSESNTIIYQPKLRKISKPVTKFQKIKPQTSQIVIKDTKSDKDKPSAEAMFDINSMPVVLSDDILTPENIEKMPIVMSDGNILTTSSNPPKLLKKQTSSVNDNVPIAATSNKTEIKTLLMNPIGETKVTTTPNILSKSSKIRGAKPMLVIDKTTGKQKIIMTKADTPVKEIKTTTLLQPASQPATKTEKFIILPTTSTQRPVRTQKIVIDPQTRKAHVLVGKGPEVAPSVIDNKPVSAKLISSASDTSATGNTVMIITNAQGAQSRIVLTSEHEKILFPNKQQPNVTQLKQIVHRITPSNGVPPKHTATAVTPLKTTPTRIVQKQKSTIITSKGQLIVGGRVTTTAQNIAPLPEIRPAPKRIIATEPKKLVQTIQKNTTEPWIFLQQKNGTVMQLTVSQFEHLQRTGQIVQKALPQDKIVVQKATTISPGETSTPPAQKQRVRKHVTETITSAKKVKHELAIAPARPVTQMPTLAPLTNTILTPAVPPISSTSAVLPGSNYSELENFEELLPSTAIARQPEPIIGHPELATPAQPQPAAVSDGQLLAIPGENFGGPPGSFYLCVEDNGTLTPIDNRPLVLENNQLVPMAEPIPMLAPQPERRDILEAALANSDVFHAEPTRDDAPDFRDLNANVSVHCRVSETSTTLNQPIMTPVEVPSKVDSEPRVSSNLEDRLAAIGVTPHTIPTSLELPITVTDPRIAPKTTDPLSNNNYGTLMPSPNTEMTYVTTDETQVSVVGPISMPILTDEDSVGKSMPILTDEVADRTVSSVESALGSPSSVDVRESENEDCPQWPRRLLTPCSDTSEASTEIPLQPIMQLSVSDPHNS